MGLDLNMYAGLVAVAAFFLSLLIVGNFETQKESQRDWFYVFAACMLLLDLGLRVLSWRLGTLPFSQRTPTNRVVRKRRRSVDRDKSRRMPALEAFFSEEVGGVVFGVPVWLVATILAACSLGWDTGWIPAPGAKTPHAPSITVENEKGNS
jgi:hypothetical protein